MSCSVNKVLLIVDIQYDFLPGGALGVQDGDQIIPVINRVSPQFENIVVTQDWHPVDHISFANRHPGRQPFETVELAYGEQTLWPVHCVQGSAGADLARELDHGRAQLIIRKGHHRMIDSYSAFLEADRKTQTGLDGYLKSRGIDHLVIAGLATDFCVLWSALDAIAYGYKVDVLEDACRGIDLNGSVDKAWETMLAAGVRKLHSGVLLGG